LLTVPKDKCCKCNVPSRHNWIKPFDFCEEHYQTFKANLSQSLEEFNDDFTKEIKEIKKVLTEK
jgi:hypothetical protein